MDNWQTSGNGPGSNASSTRAILSSPGGKDSPPVFYNDVLGQQPLASTSKSTGRRPSRQMKSPFAQPGQEGASQTAKAGLTDSLSLATLATRHHLSDCDLSGDSSSTGSVKSAPQICDAASSFSNAPSDGHRSTRRPSHHQVYLERKYLHISAPMLKEIIVWRRSLIVLAIAFFYGLFALAAILLREHPTSSTDSSGHWVPRGPPEEDWTQEMIAGWHRERPLNLSSEYTSLEHRHMRIRECRSRTARKMLLVQVAVSTTTTTTHRPHNVSSTPGGASASMLSTRLPTTERPARRRQKFEALNGCLFRLNTNSDTAGDICCCAGVPRYLRENSIQTASTTTTKNAPEPGNVTSGPTSTTTAVPKTSKRKYLRPQVMCFATAAANLFNWQHLIAPIANEYNLKNAFISSVGKCITCSCCHEHEPEKVNKLLANVPLDSDAKSRMIDKNGHQLIAPASSTIGGYKSNPGEDDPGSGFWNATRDRLMSWMHLLDDFYFWLYDLLDQTLMAARYGMYPGNVSDSSGVLLIQGTSFVSHAQVNESLLRPSVRAGRLMPKLIAPLPPEANLYIDEDTYDDFTTTTTTTTSTTTSTTAVPSSSARPKRKRKKMKNDSTRAHLSKEERARRRKLRGQRRKEKAAAATKVDKVSPEAIDYGGSKVATNASTSTTTKSPTVIINVYAGGQHTAAAFASSNTTKVPATGQRHDSPLEQTGANRLNSTLPSDSIKVADRKASDAKIALIAEPRVPAGDVGGGSVGDDGGLKLLDNERDNIKLRIKLDRDGQQMLLASNSTRPHAVNSSSLTSSTLPPPKSATGALVGGQKGEQTDWPPKMTSVSKALDIPSATPAEADSGVTTTTTTTTTTTKSAGASKTINLANDTLHASDSTAHKQSANSSGSQLRVLSALEKLRLPSIVEIPLTSLLSLAPSSTSTTTTTTSTTMRPELSRNGTIVISLDQGSTIIATINSPTASTLSPTTNSDPKLIARPRQQTSSLNGTTQQVSETTIQQQQGSTTSGDPIKSMGDIDSRKGAQPDGMPGGYADFGGAPRRATGT